METGKPVIFADGGADEDTDSYGGFDAARFIEEQEQRRVSLVK